MVGYKIASYVFHHVPELVDNLSQQVYKRWFYQLYQMLNPV